MSKNFWKIKTIKSYIKIYIKTLPGSLSCILIICIVFILAYLRFYTYIEKTSKMEQEVVKIFYNLSLTYIASLIFYFITIHIKEQRNKKIYYNLIIVKIINIIYHTKDFVSLAKNPNQIIPINTYPSKEDIEKIFTNINSNDETNVCYIKDSETFFFTYAQYLRYIITNNSKFIESMYTIMQFLDSDFVKLISKIENHPISTGINNRTNPPLSNGSLDIICDKYYSYMELIKELEEYYNSKIKFYIKE